MSSCRRCLRIAAWLALAVIYAIAFHYAKKYEGDMLTDHFQTTGFPARPAPAGASDQHDICRGRAQSACRPENLGHAAPKSGAVRCNTGDAITTSIQE
jgi:hypothetical protein